MRETTTNTPNCPFLVYLGNCQNKLEWIVRYSLTDETHQMTVLFLSWCSLSSLTLNSLIILNLIFISTSDTTEFSARINKNMDFLQAARLFLYLFLGSMIVNHSYSYPSLPTTHAPVVAHTAIVSSNIFFFEILVF